MRGSYTPSFETFFKYIQPFLRDKIEVNIDGKSFQLTPPKQIKISKNLYRGYTCELCISCCKGYINFYSDWHSNLLENKPNITVLINGKEYNFYTEPHTDKRCIHLKDDNKCDIHITNPLHCMFPLIKFKRVKDIVYITKERFHRKLGKLCEVREWVPLTDETFQWDLDRFDFLRKVLVNDFIEIIEICKFDEIHRKVKNKECDVK